MCIRNECASSVPARETKIDVEQPHWQGRLRKMKAGPIMQIRRHSRSKSILTPAMKSAYAVDTFEINAMQMHRYDVQKGRGRKAVSGRQPQ